MTYGVSLSLQQPDGRHRDILARHRVLRWLRLALQGQSAQITLRVVDADEGRQLNHAYRRKDYATNVLTFDYAREPVVVADLVLCAPVVEQEALEQRLPLVNHYAHLVIHGTLHALGMDHQRPREAQRMEAHESSLLAQLGIADPYAVPAVRPAR
jgi:probable rRNA maturation factor